MKKFRFSSLLSLVFLFAMSTPSAQEPLLKFGVFADCQSAQTETGGARRYTLSPSKLDQAIAAFNIEGVKFQVSLGDLVDRDIESMRELVPILEKAEQPTYHILGNHDFLKDSFDVALKIMNLESPYYYSVVENGVRLIFLNSNENTTYSTQEGTQEYDYATSRMEYYKAKGAMNAQPWNGEVGEKQLKWLETELKEARKANEIVIVMSHHPLAYIVNVVTMLNNREVRKVLQRYSDVVKVHLSGHHHMGGYSRVKGIDYLILKGMVETENNRYAIVKVYNDRIEIDGRGDEKDRIFKFK